MIKFIVSVPLRGLWFLSLKNALTLIRVYDSFRPLTGIMVLITHDVVVDGCSPDGGFRPLTGIMVLI